MSNIQLNEVDKWLADPDRYGPTVSISAAKTIDHVLTGLVEQYRQLQRDHKTLHEMYTICGKKKQLLEDALDALESTNDH